MNSIFTRTFWLVTAILSIFIVLYKQYYRCCLYKCLLNICTSYVRHIDIRHVNLLVWYDKMKIEKEQYSSSPYQKYYKIVYRPYFYLLHLALYNSIFVFILKYTHHIRCVITYISFRCAILFIYNIEIIFTMI